MSPRTPGDGVLFATRQAASISTPVAPWVPAFAGMTAGGWARMENYYYVYLLASRVNGTLYVGVTNNLVRRVAEHKAHYVKGFTADYCVTVLVWYEVHTSIERAILREKRVKKWKR